MKWEVKPLGDVCEIRNGSTPSKGNPAFWENGTIPWFTIDDIREQGRLITSTRQKITEAALSGTSVKLLPKNSVLLCCTASVGEFAITGIPLTTNQQFNGLVVKEPKKLDANFLMHFVSTLKDELLGMSGKTTIDFIPISRLRDVTVPLPPLPEQQRIVGKLDAAFAALSEAQALVERNRANARELFESYLNGVFERKGDGWVEKQLTDVARIRTGKVDANHQAGDGKYAFYTCAFGEFKSPTWSFEGPSVILPGNGANVGVTFFYDGRFEAYQRTYVVNEFGAEVNPRYAYFCFRAGWKPYIATRQFGSATNYIVLGDLKQFPVHLPSLKEQAIILGEFEEMEQHVLELETTYQQKLSDLDALKKGLLGAAFRGEL